MLGETITFTSLNVPVGYFMDLLINFQLVSPLGVLGGGEVSVPVSGVVLLLQVIIISAIVGVQTVLEDRVYGS